MEIYRALRRSLLPLLALIAAPLPGWAQQQLGNDAFVTAELTRSGQVDPYEFTATAGDIVFLNVADRDDTRMQPFVTVFNPDGTQATSALGNRTAVIGPLTIVETGNHVVLVQDSGANDVGFYTVHFARAPGANEGGRLENDARLPRTLRVGDIDTFTFDAVAGERIHMAAADIDVTGSQPRLRLIAPDGTIAINTLANTTAIVRDYEIDSDGVWTVVVSEAGSDQETDYELFFARAPGSNEKGLLPNDARRGATLGIGDIDTWTFDANAGDRIHLNVSDVDLTRFQPDLSVYGPDGDRLSSGLANTTASVTGLTATGTGIHTVVIRDAGGDDTADYELYFALAPGASEGGTLVGNVVRVGTLDRSDIDTFEFGGRAGATVVLNVNDDDEGPLQPAVRIYDEAGTLVIGTVANGTATISQVLPADGFYTVVIQDNGGDDAGPYTLDFLYIGAAPPVRTRSVVLEPNLWHLLGVPGNTGGTLGDLFGSILDLADYDNPDAEDGWILFGYEPATDTAAARYVGLGLSDPVPQGTGFWFLHLADTALRLNLPPAATDASGTMGGGCAPGAICITTPLAASPGGDWTIGAVPTTRSPGVDTFRVVTDVTAPDCTDGCTLDEAADAGYTAPNGFWVYEQSTDNYRLLSGVDSVAPWTGFWLRTTEAGGAASPELLTPVR